MVGAPARLAIVTGELAPELSDGGKRVARGLADRGFDPEPVMWNDPWVEWPDYDAVLVRSCWDYPENRVRFRAMLDELAGAGVPVCNSLRVIRWNLHKTYLTDLADAGVTIPPTAVVERGADTSLAAVLADRGWSEAVVKPAVGAMSDGVWRASADGAAADERRFADLVAEHDVLVQAFVPEIATGERSAVFIGGAYSHAWNSLPTDDDVTAFDGVDADYAPTDEMRAQATAALQAARDLLGVEPEALPYARVDYAERAGELVLMELELIEPYLGFERGEGAVDRFCEAVAAYFRR